MELILFVLIVVLIAANVIASRLVLRDDLLERRQRVLQFAVVWLVPILGAAGIFAIHRSHEQVPSKFRDPPDPGDEWRDPVRSRHSHEVDASD
jgi:hypothetical protein